MSSQTPLAADNAEIVRRADVIFLAVKPQNMAAVMSGLPESASLQEVLESAPVQQHFQRVFDKLAAGSTGSATRVARAHLMAEPPSLDKGEITDKGSINQRAVLQHRAHLVNALHDGSLPFTLVPQH